jgi:hypothetical protein
MHTFQINALIQFLASAACFEHRDAESSAAFHLLDCLHKCIKTYRKKLHVQMVFLMNTWCSQHVEDAKNWIKTLF